VGAEKTPQRFVAGHTRPTVIGFPALIALARTVRAPSASKNADTPLERPGGSAAMAETAHCLHRDDRGRECVVWQWHRGKSCARAFPEEARRCFARWHALALKAAFALVSEIRLVALYFWVHRFAGRPDCIPFRILRRANGPRQLRLAALGRRTRKRCVEAAGDILLTQALEIFDRAWTVPRRRDCGGRMRAAGSCGSARDPSGDPRHSSGLTSSAVKFLGLATRA